MQDPAAGGRLFLVITTFNRSAYLRGLLDSVALLDPAPAGVVVVDNASTDSTADVVADAAFALPFPLVHHRLPANVGGAGGFSAGIRRALSEGADWLWLMDDDVVALPDALGALKPWMERYRCLHGRRWDSSGKPFFWQHHFNEVLGVHLPVRGNVFADSRVFHTNVGCFEGMLVHSDVVRDVGLPDPRFFLNGDDTTYGWLISQRYSVAYVDEFVLRKARPQKQIDLGLRHLNDSSDLGRFCAMRNRGHLARYLQHEGRWNRTGFALGTALTAAKEVFRLLAVEHTFSGLGVVRRGWREARKILADEDWQPMPPLAPAAPPPTGGSAGERGVPADDIPGRGASEGIPGANGIDTRGAS
ncbi:glycosyltransferase [Arthrobacter sp. H41]|uniref:glycosyltransferase n=1 Tax=Arthrobacter sp. H41 TaxID=1312978 RepID=UPI0004B8AE0A|nr:glycosyltransferase [Arthrobacter sp. H41]